MKSNRDEQILDKVTADIRNEKIDPAAVSAAADRVWARVSAAAGETEFKLPTVDRIEGCADYQSLIPAYLAGKLSEARSLLLVDHTHECIPCRKAMNEARSKRSASIRPAVSKPRFTLQPVVMRWGIAAALVIGLGLLAIPFVQTFWPYGFEATVQAAEGQVFQVADTQTALVNAGAKLKKGEKVRTAKDGRAVVQLGDGTLIEMKDRSELYLTKNSRGTTIHLSRGSVVVEAAKQKDGQLFVESGDSLVSVTGTIFSVNNGTKGSRVSVIEGEVNLNHAGKDRVLRPGEQVTTNPSIATIPVKDEIAWSRNASRYAAVMAGWVDLKKQLNTIQQPGVRYSTHLLDLMPEGTVVYAALPNLANSIAESHRVIQERISQNAALREWWAKEQSGKSQNMDQVVETIRQFGSYLGDEIAVSVSLDEKSEPSDPLVLAELKNSQGFREFIEQEIAKYSGNKKGPQLQFVENPMTATAVAGDSKDKLYIWIQDNLFAASPKLQQLQNLATAKSNGGQTSFTATPFRNRIAQVYQEGAGLVVAANLEKVVVETKDERAKGKDAAKTEAALDKLGILSVKYFVLDQKDSNGKTHTQASLSFSDGQRGIPSWLAAPGPMGSLEYISPDANVVAGFVVKNPQTLVDDLLGVLETVEPDLRKTLDTVQSKHGLNIRDDIAAPLGGEFAFAIDGPILPTPSWKLVFEVNDPTHLQQTLERLVGEANKQAALFGKRGLAWEQNELGGRKYYKLKSADFGFLEVNYTYINGYLIIGPSSALVEKSLRSQESGLSLLRSAKFTAGLPADGNANFSAVFYHNIGGLVPAGLASQAAKLPSGPQKAVEAIAADMQPTLAYAYAQGDSITFAANTEGGPFGLGPATLLGMPSSLEMQSIIQRGMGGGKK
ncbi:MAG TPA: FecR domain-containing protein [Pyrinomonadaceae bacterium]|nr:FecR domain-containing protein [Pyrinomonadaceae bacterium]